MQFPFSLMSGYCREKGCRVKSISLNGEDIDNEREYLVGMTRNCTESCYTYFAKVFDESRFEVVSLSTYNDLARWFLNRNKPGILCGGTFFMDRKVRVLWKERSK